MTRAPSTSVTSTPVVERPLPSPCRDGDALLRTRCRLAAGVLSPVPFHGYNRDKVYPGYPHGMCTTHADVIKRDLLEFIRG